MLFKNAIRILAENFKNVYKLTLYKIIVILVGTALCTAILLPQLFSILHSMPMEEFLADVNDFFGAFFSVNAEKLQTAQQNLLGREGEIGSIERLLKLISSKSTGIILSCVGCVLVYFVGKFFDAIGSFAVGVALNDKMSAYADTGFLNAYFSHFGRACKYGILYALVSFGVDVLTVALFILFLATTSVLTAIFLIITFVVALQALKMSLVGHWLPAMVSETAPLTVSMRKVNKQKHFFWKMFSTYLVSCYLILILNVSAMVFTFGSALLLAVPMSFMLLICVQFVGYYTVRGKKYFVTFNSIETNPDRGDREHIFAYIDTPDMVQLPKEPAPQKPQGFEQGNQEEN